MSQTRRFSCSERDSIQAFLTTSNNLQINTVGAPCLTPEQAQAFALELYYLANEARKADDHKDM